MVRSASSRALPAAPGHAAGGSDDTPDSVTLFIGARAIRVPRWWAEAQGYADGAQLRESDAALAQEVSAAARGGLAALDRLTARRGPPRPRRVVAARAQIRVVLTVSAVAGTTAAIVTLALARAFHLAP